MFGLQNLLAAVLSIGYVRLMLLGVVTGGHAVIHWYQQLFPVIIPSVKFGLSLTDVQIGTFTAARQLAVGTLTLPAGMLADALMRHRALILASALVSMGVGYLLLGYVHTFGWAIVAAGLVGLGIALWHPPAMASLSYQFPERRATALAVHGMGATLSDTLTPLAAGYFLIIFPWRSVLGFQIVPALLVALLVWRGLAGVFAGSSASEPGRSVRMRELGALATNSAFIGIAAASGLLQMGRLTVSTFLPVYLQEYLGYTPFGLGFYFTLLHGMGIVSQPFLGWLSDRFGRRAVLLPSFLTLGVLYSLIRFAEPGFQLGLVITAIGLFFYTLTNVVAAAVMDVAGSRIQASSLGFTSLVSQFVVLPTPIVAGFLIGIYGIGSAFLLSGGFMFLAALAVWQLKIGPGKHGE